MIAISTVRAGDSLADVILAIFGPTGSGKTAVAEELARRLDREIVSADAMQVYRGLPILTNQSDFPSRLVGIWELDHEGSVAEYQTLAHEAIDEVLAAGDTPIVAGGTGLYFRAALADLQVPPAPRPGRRAYWDRRYEELGADQAHGLLADLDPSSAAAVHPNDRRRVVRALELAEAGSSLKPREDRLWDDRMRHPTIVFGLEVPKDVLEQRIVERAHAMFERGVEEEVRHALAHPISSTAGTIHGLRAIAEVPGEEALAALIVQTRRYAAYQRKWMRRIPGLVSVRGDRPPGETADEILEVARARQRLPARRAG
jgi:tRNA dimethylallyltransferase